MEINENDLIWRLLKRAEIRRQIPGRKSVQEGKPDRIADLLEEAANEIMKLRSRKVKNMNNVCGGSCESCDEDCGDESLESEDVMDMIREHKLTIGTIVDKSKATGPIKELAPAPFYNKCSNVNLSTKPIKTAE